MIKKIGFIVSTLENSGPVNIMYNIIKYLDTTKSKIYIYTLSDEKQRTRINEFKNLNCYVEKLEVSNKDIVLGNLSKIQNILERDRIDVIHSHCLRSNIIISKLTNNIKKICTIHANIQEDYKFKFGILKGSILKYIYLRTLKNIDFKICCSKSVYNQMKAQTKEEVEYIVNGVDLEKFMESNSKKESKEKLQISTQDKIFITVGSLCQRKDSIFIAKNIEKLNLSNYKLLLLGEGIQKKEIESLKNPNIILLGKVSNVQEYLSASDYYISASNSEGMPNSVLEACAFKLPLILSSIPSHLEIYELNQSSGKIFDKKLKFDFENKIKEILTSDYYQMSNASYKIVQNTLNAKKMSELYQNIYLKKGPFL